MFTGIVEQIGSVVTFRANGNSGKLTISLSAGLTDLVLGESIAVNGVCLTVCDFGSNWFCADVMAETTKKSNLMDLKPGSKVNLERAMKADGRFGGHMVSGHIDGTGKISNILPEENAIWYEINTTQDILKYIVTKGSIAIDGTSLTVVSVDNTSFKVSVIPHTKESTILNLKGIGQIVNLECDVIGKYIEKLINYPSQNHLQDKNKESLINLSYLTKHGFV